MTLYKDIIIIMPYFDKFIHVYVRNLSILLPPLKIWMPKNLTIANFRHPVSKSWLRPCLVAQSAGADPGFEKGGFDVIPKNDTGGATDNF